MDKKMEEDTGAQSSMDSDEIELTLRRFASKQKDRALSLLLDSLFTAPVGKEMDKESSDGQE